MTPHVMKTPMKVRNSIVCRVVYEIKDCQDHTNATTSTTFPKLWLFEHSKLLSWKDDIPLGF